jgi:hypothetical protein
MAAAACGCIIVHDREGHDREGHDREGDDDWIVADVAPRCLHRHVVGQRGRVEGEPARVTGVGACVTIVFERSCERASSRTVMLTTER